MKGDVVYITVGQRPAYFAHGGGAGGSFVWRAGSEDPLVAAGGGGGAWADRNASVLCWFALVVHHVCTKGLGWRCALL